MRALRDPRAPSERAGWARSIVPAIVALKVLPDDFGTDSGRMPRFQREAEVLASLNHPNIAHIYGVEECALVMKLVEGELL